MKKNYVILFALVIIDLLITFPNHVIAQQSKVDSAIMLLHKSTGSNPLDIASFNSARYLLFSTTLTKSQLEQIEAVVSNYKHTRIDYSGRDIMEAAFDGIAKNDAEKAITFGKMRIENLDKSNSSTASSLRSHYLYNLRFPFRNSDRLEEGFRYYTQKLNQYIINNDSACISICYHVLGSFYGVSGLHDLAIYSIKKSASYLDTVNNNDRWLSAIAFLGYQYSIKGDMAGCLKYSGMAFDERRKSAIDIYSAINMARVMLINNQLDSAGAYIKFAKVNQLRRPEMRAAILQIEAQYKIETGALSTADSLLNECWRLINTNNIPVNASSGTITPDYYLALLRAKQNRFDKAISLLKMDIQRLNNKRVDILRDYKLMAELYKKAGDANKAAETYAIFIAKRDSLLADQEKYRAISFESEQQLNEKEQSIANLESKNRIASLSRNFLIGITALLLLLAGGIYQRFRFKKKANTVLEETLTNLKSTQSQLIQSEKMASLGELTAGIAHEIQNPLNFVNNFSDVNTELIDEAKQEIDKGNLNDAKTILDDLKDNQLKINHHGKRADAIVKGMLQHSRTSSGQKEPTDINALCDEYLRLSYHGLRAKDKTFNAELKTDFDNSIGNINVVPQDIGRVILNLINNAFYAVNEKAKQNIPGYEPTVTVNTKKSEGKVEISVKDNGNGIPDSIKEKIFQPFFTTKPTGQGTGLGLSLSYDIVNAHGGELKVEAKEGEGSIFTIKIPAS